MSFDSVQWECSVLQTSCVHLVTSSQRLCRHNLVGLFVSFSKVKNASSPHSIRSPIKRTSHTHTHTQTHIGRWILEHTLSSVCKYLLQSIGSWHSKHFTEATLKNLACLRTMLNDGEGTRAALPILIPALSLRAVEKMHTVCFNCEACCPEYGAQASLRHLLAGAPPKPCSSNPCSPCPILSQLNQNAQLRRLRGRVSLRTGLCAKLWLHIHVV